MTFSLAPWWCSFGTVNSQLCRQGDGLTDSRGRTRPSEDLRVRPSQLGGLVQLLYYSINALASAAEDVRSRSYLGAEAQCQFPRHAGPCGGLPVRSFWRLRFPCCCLREAPFSACSIGSSGRRQALRSSIAAR